MIGNSETSKKHLYLNSLREIIVNNSENLVKFADTLTQFLVDQSEKEAESTQSIIAEMIGRLIGEEPVMVIEILKDNKWSESTNQKATIARSIKYGTQKAKENEAMIFEYY